MVETQVEPREAEAHVEGPAQKIHIASSLEHMEEEIRHLEGMGRPRWDLWLGGLVLLAALVGGYMAFVRNAPAARAPIPAPVVGLRIETSEPRPGKLAGPPTHFAWESIAGRHDYLFTLGLVGPDKPLVQRAVKNATLDLYPEEVALLKPGTSYVWHVTARQRDGRVLGSGQSSFQLR